MNSCKIRITMKKQIITLTIAAFISGAAVTHIPSGMYRSAETYG